MADGYGAGGAGVSLLPPVIRTDVVTRRQPATPEREPERERQRRKRERSRRPQDRAPDSDREEVEPEDDSRKGNKLNIRA